MHVHFGAFQNKENVDDGNHVYFLITITAKMSNLVLIVEEICDKNGLYRFLGTKNELISWVNANPLSTSDFCIQHSPQGKEGSLYGWSVSSLTRLHLTASLHTNMNIHSFLVKANLVNLETSRTVIISTTVNVLLFVSSRISTN